MVVTPSGKEAHGEEIANSHDGGPSTALGPFSALLFGSSSSSSSSASNRNSASSRVSLENVHVASMIRETMMMTGGGGGGGGASSSISHAPMRENEGAISEDQRNMRTILDTMERLESGNVVDDDDDMDFNIGGEDEDDDDDRMDDDDDGDDDGGGMDESSSGGEMENVSGDRTVAPSKKQRQLSLSEFQREFVALSSSSEDDSATDGDSTRSERRKGKRALSREELEELESEMFDVEGGAGRRRRRRRRRPARSDNHIRRGRRKKEMPENISNLLGDANLHYINHEFKEAIEKLLEVVRLMPTVPDAYHTLALIAEEMQQPKKALEYLFFAAMLTPKDVELWKRLAVMAGAQNNVQQSVYCLTRIVRLEPQNVDATFDLAVLHTQLGNTKKAIDVFSKVIQLVPDDFEVVIHLARLYHSENLANNATALLEQTVNRYLQNVDFTVVNMLLEEYMNMGQFEQCITVVNNLCTERSIPLETLPAEIRVKIASCKAYLGRIDDATAIFNDIILRHDIDQYMDQYFDIAETYYAVKEYALALRVYHLLIHIESYNKPAIWLKVAQCYRHCDQLEDAIQFCQMVLREVPSNVDARITLSEIYKKLGRMDDASRVLGNDYTSTMEALTKLHDSMSGPSAANAPVYMDEDDEEHPVSHAINETHVEDIRIMTRQAWMLFESKKMDEFLNLSVPLIQTVLSISKTRKREKEQRIYMPRQSIQAEKAKKQLELLLARKTEHLNWTWEEAVDALGEEQFVRLIFITCRTLAERKRFTVAYRIMEILLDKRLVTNKEHVQNFRYLLLGVAFNSNDYTKAYDQCKSMLIGDPSATPLWNLFNKIAIKTGRYQSQQKFLARQLLKHPSCVPLMILTANNSCANGTYRLALGEYFRAYLKMPKDPLINLCIGVNYLNLVMNRRTANRHLIVIQAFTFLYRYYDLMKGNQEANYNLGRAYHQLGINHLAVYYYEKVLAQSGSQRHQTESSMGNTIIDTIQLIMKYDADKIGSTSSTNTEESGADEQEVGAEEEDDDSQSTSNLVNRDLKFEAAHNLVLLYRDSGNDDLARHVLLDHLTI